MTNAVLAVVECSEAAQPLHECTVHWWGQDPVFAALLVFAALGPLLGRILEQPDGEDDYDWEDDQ